MSSPDLEVRAPRIADGGSLWSLANRAGGLDVNASYAYLLWCRDFAATSVIAEIDGRAVGFVTGYLRPSEAETLVVWQVAVEPEARGRRVAGQMLGALVDRVGPRHLEATVTADNEPSRRLFSALARDRGAEISFGSLFLAGHFPDDHEPEDLLRIGPFPH